MLLVNYEYPSWGTRLSLAYHTSGDQIYSLGTSEFETGGSEGFPDLMEKGRHFMDFSWSQRINKFLSLKAGVQNMFNAPVTLYEDYDRNYKYSPEHSDGDIHEGDVLYPPVLFKALLLTGLQLYLLINS